jgi:two-component system KDP operon response regulator KdpE
MTGEPSRPKVLVVEDEEPVRRVLSSTLPAHGFDVIEAETGADALRDAAQFVPDLVLLDLGLPDIDGIEVTRKLREWTTIPIVVLTARGQERAKVEALDAGADDYVTKPFGFPELLARLRVALRHGARAPMASSASVFRSGPLRVDLEARRVFVGDAEVHLTPTEYRLLVVLVKNAGRVVTQRTLLREVWGPLNPEGNRYLHVYMTYLRRKLESDPHGPRLFETEVGVGYRLRVDERPGGP